MTITRRVNVPCVSQTQEWKGFFEAHFMNGKQIDEKYPILNKFWVFHQIGYLKIEGTNYDGVYVAFYKDFHAINQPYSDPWYRELKYETPIQDTANLQRFHTSVASNAVLLEFHKIKL